MRVVVDVVDTLGLVRLKLEVWCGRTQAPDLDCPIQTCRSEGIGVFGVDGEGHDVV